MNVERARLHRALNPETVTVVGDKQFTGQLYSVQLDEKEIGHSIVASSYPSGV